MYDVAIIGGGPGGYVGAIRAAQLGLRVAVVELDRVGGTCLNRGCIPTKAMVRSAEMYQDTLHASEYGVLAGEVSLDLAAVVARKDRVVESLTSGVIQLFRSNGVDLYQGRGDIPGPGAVNISLNDGGKEQLKTANIIIATGSKPQMPPVPSDQWGLTIDSTDALSPSRVPGELLVIGGGVLGIEFACIYSAFGSKVTCIKRSPLILPPIDPELSQRLMILLKRKGITITTGIFMRSIEALPGGRKVLHAEERKGEQTREVSFEADEILVAMGRVPNHGGLDLDSLGIEYGRGGIKTDARLRTSAPGIYAIGDVCGRYWLMPVASAEGVVAAEDIAGQGKDIDYRAIPQCVFSMPEVASVGMSEKEARDEGREVKISKFPFSANGRAMAMGETEGLVKIVAGAGGEILGLHILGPRATDLVHEGSIAIALGAKAHDLANILLHAHPTLSEAIMEAAHGIDGQPIHLATRRR
jgi:dihydrolipoamide dehydrogenase